jgi:CBS domain-containing protein
MFSPALSVPSVCRVPFASPYRTARRKKTRASLPRAAFGNESLSTESSKNFKTNLAVGIGGFTRTGGEDVMDQARVVDPYGLVRDVMSSPAHTLTPGLELDDPVVRQTLERYCISQIPPLFTAPMRDYILFTTYIASRLFAHTSYKHYETLTLFFYDRYHGVPVVSADTGVLVGVLSRTDIVALNGETRFRTVGETMTSPPVCVKPKAHVAEAAGMMLQHKVHRLPVIDDRNVPIGIATREDIFEPLIATRDDVLVDQNTRRYVRDARDADEDDVHETVKNPHKRHSLKSSATPHRVRLAARPATKPFLFRRDAPLTALSVKPRNAGCGDSGDVEETETQAIRRSKKLGEDFQEDTTTHGLDVDRE